jgi:hypothetical protein
MKNLLLLITFIALFIPSSAQQAKQLLFRGESHDFGEIPEHKGPVIHEFVFTNNSARPVKILNVQASCGCTTPDWSKDPIAPGKNGFVQASYDPTGRPGYFNKSLTVTTDLEANPIILQIKGQVTTDHEENVDATGFSHSKGNLKFRTSGFNLGKILNRDEFVVKEFPFINAGPQPVTFTENVTTPKHIRVEVKPLILPAGGKGVVRISYNGKLKNQYGFQSDNIELNTDDGENAVKSFSVLATIEDYFPQMSGEELEKAAHLTLADQSLDFGRVNANSQIVREVEFTNTGHKNLDIRAVQPNCTCVTASVNKTSLKPGESGTIKVTFDPQDRKGSHQKAVTVYSNDPRNPVQRFTFMAYME